MCHVNFDNIIKISSSQIVRDVPKLMKPTNTICKECQLQKKTRVNFKSKKHFSSGLLDLVHTNFCGTSRVIILQGDNYFMLLSDDYSRMMWVSFLREKFEALDKFKIFKAMVEIEIALKLSCLGFDIGGEFTFNEFNAFCEEHGVKR